MADPLARDDEIDVYYLLSSTTLDPDAVTTATGIVPTEVHRLGEGASVAPRGTHYWKENRWEVKSNPSMSLELDDHVRWVLAQLEPGWETLASLGRQHDASLQCVIDTAESTGPAMWFDHDVVTRLAELHASIDIDYYSFRAGSSDDQD